MSGDKQKTEVSSLNRRVRSAVSNGSNAIGASAVPVEASNESEAENLKKLGVRLRNLLKLPKAHKWVCYEWFYSNLDQ